MAIGFDTPSKRAQEIREKLTQVQNSQQGQNLGQIKMSPTLNEAIRKVNIVASAIVSDEFSKKSIEERAKMLEEFVFLHSVANELSY